MPHADSRVANRVMCDFVHRQKIPRRLTDVERGDNFTEITCTLDAEDYILLQITRASEVR